MKTLCLLALLAGPDPVTLEDFIAEIPAPLVPVLQDKVERAKELAAEAKEADARGDKAEGRRLRAEGYALLAEHHHEQGSRSKAQAAYNKAKSYGWTEAPPWGGDAPTPRSRPRPTPSAAPREFRQPEQPERDAPRTIKKPRTDRFGRLDTWPFYEYNPLKNSRNASWHVTLGIPPMEEAVAIPKKTWDFRIWMELQSSDYSVVVNGETTQFHADMHEEALELNYGLMEGLEVGGRITMGELLEAGDDVIRVFDGGSQIVPTGDRAYAVSEFVARAKYVIDLDFATIGGLFEAKLPLASAESLISAGTMDLAFIGLASATLIEDFIKVHVNMGPVMPLGNSDLFDPEVDPNMFFTYAAGGAMKIHNRIVLNLQIEGNTSGWADIAVLEDPIMRVTAGGRWKAGDKIWLQGAAGFGLDEISGAIMANLSVDFTF